MKIFIDIGHPAHVHYFKNFYKIMRGRGHQIIVSARDKEMTHELLKSYDIPFFSRGKGGNSALGKLGYLLKGDSILLKKALTFKPDIFLSFSSPYAAQVSALLGKPHIAFDDTEHAKLARLFYKPFTEVILSPVSYRGSLGNKQIKFNSFLELCYLHPDYFTPDPSVLRELDIDQGEKFMIIRFVSWQANHDMGHKGISIDNKRKAVEEFSKHSRVFISSETDLPADLKKYSLPVAPGKIHHVLYYASLLYGESATMASEAAVLGTPAFFLNETGLGYTDELEHTYGLVYNFSESDADQQASILKGVEVLNFKDSIWTQKRTALLNDKIDPTAYLVWFTENYPESKHLVYKSFLR